VLGLAHVVDVTDVAEIERCRRVVCSRFISGGREGGREGGTEEEVSSCWAWLVSWIWLILEMSGVAVG